jgi:hypothetical protein
MSGYSEGILASNADGESKYAFLQKPFTGQGLALKVRAALDSVNGCEGDEAGQLMTIDALEETRKGTENE